MSRFSRTCTSRCLGRYPKRNKFLQHLRGGSNCFWKRLYPDSQKASLETEASRADKTPIGIESKGSMDNPASNRVIPCAQIRRVTNHWELSRCSRWLYIRSR